MSDNEVECVGDSCYTNDEVSLRSIAISLKRIADKLELSQKQPIIMSTNDE